MVKSSLMKKVNEGQSDEFLQLGITPRPYDITLLYLCSIHFMEGTFNLKLHKYILVQGFKQMYDLFLDSITQQQIQRQISRDSSKRLTKSMNGNPTFQRILPAFLHGIGAASSRPEATFLLEI